MHDLWIKMLKSFILLNICGYMYMYVYKTSYSVALPFNMTINYHGIKKNIFGNLKKMLRCLQHSLVEY